MCVWWVGVGGWVGEGAGAQLAAPSARGLSALGGLLQQVAAGAVRWQQVLSCS